MKYGDNVAFITQDGKIEFGIIASISEIEDAQGERTEIHIATKTEPGFAIVPKDDVLKVAAWYSTDLDSLASRTASYQWAKEQQQQIEAEKSRRESAQQN